MYVYKQLASLSIILFILTACSKEQVCQQADFVLFNTKIYTATNDYPEAEALAILGDKLIFVGSNKEALSFACNENKILDLQNAEKISNELKLSYSYLLLNKKNFDNANIIFDFDFSIIDFIPWNAAKSAP